MFKLSPPRATYARCWAKKEYMSRTAHKDRRRSISGLWVRTCSHLAAACLFLSIFFATPLPSAAEKLRISYASVTGNTAGITYIAQRAGLFEKQGLDEIGRASCRERV